MYEYLPPKDLGRVEDPRREAITMVPISFSQGQLNFYNPEKALKLEMIELNLIQHIVSHLELQIQDYVEVRNPLSKAQLLQVLSQFEERYSAKKAQGSSKNYNRKRRYWDVRRKSSYDRRNRNWRDVECLDRQNDR
ncbi:hypothetical protein TNCV_1195481 [Trichonephila clavipes]|nr:hypothetical protein TNCV_1195481 [Trichonephila clavipes]